MSQVSILILHDFSVFSLTDSQHGDSPGFERAEQNQRGASAGQGSKRLEGWFNHSDHF
jgi:hypothetical protein